MSAWATLHFKRTDVDPSIHYAIKARAALVVQRRRSEARVACVNRRAAGQKRVREGRATVVLQRTEHRIGVDLIAGSDQETAAIIAAKVVAK